MPTKITREDINNTVWRACDTFRGVVDPAQYKDYILVMLFIKYLSDLWKDKRETYEKRYKGNKKRIQRALDRERFVVPDDCDFDFLYSKRDAANLGEIINIALEAIEDANKAKLENVFRNIDFNSEPALGQTKDRNRRLQNLLNDFAELDLRPSHLEDRDIIGDVYEFLIGRFAAGAGKKAGEFYTPPEVSTLLSRLLAPKSGDRICDPACGSGSLLIKVGRQVGDANFFLAGQESNGSTWALCKMNMFLHEVDSARIEWCDTINNPRLVEGDSLMKFNVVVANPPFSLDKWGQDSAATDRYNRFHRGVPPKSRGDYAFISHMVEIALEGEGKVGVVVPHGVLFRGGSEGKIRQQFLEQNSIEAVIGLPANLFYGTGIPAALLLLNKARKPWKRARSHRDKHILFIDASREYEDIKNQNRLRDRDIYKIVRTFDAFKQVEKYAYPATLAEIEENEFNLNIPRYVDTFEPEPEVDIPAVRKEIETLEGELTTVKKKLNKHLKELGL